MDNEPEVIRRQMEQTRTDLQEKLETLEKQVTETVQEAASAATETVQSVTETVQSVKEAVQDTVETVRGTVEDTVGSVKESLDINQHIRAHPWAMFIGATAIGYFGTRLLFGKGEPAPVPAMPAASDSVSTTPTHSRPNGRHGHSKSEKNGAHAAAAPAEPGLLGRIADHYSAELGKLQSLAVGALGAVVREMLASSAAPALAEQITDIVDGVTEKLGGKPVRGPLFQKTPPTAKDDMSEYGYDAPHGYDVPAASQKGPASTRGGVSLS